jgi:hypothetical protein
LHFRLPGPDGVGFNRESLFRLVREARREGVPEPQVLYGVLCEACRRLGVSEGDAYSAVLDAWDRVELDAPDLLELAIRRADKSPVPFVTLPPRLHYDPSHQRVAALAYWLEAFHAGRLPFFPLPTVRIAEWLGVSRQTAGRCVRRLDEAGVITLRRDATGRPYWDHESGQCREARYTGPRPPAD